MLIVSRPVDPTIEVILRGHPNEIRAIGHCILNLLQYGPEHKSIIEEHRKLVVELSQRLRDI